MTYSIKEGKLEEGQFLQLATDSPELIQSIGQPLAQKCRFELITQKHINDYLASGATAVKRMKIFSLALSELIIVVIVTTMIVMVLLPKIWIPFAAFGGFILLSFIRNVVENSIKVKENDQITAQLFKELLPTFGKAAYGPMGPNDLTEDETHFSRFLEENNIEGGLSSQFYAAQHYLPSPSSKRESDIKHLRDLQRKVASSKKNSFEDYYRNYFQEKNQLTKHIQSIQSSIAVKQGEYDTFVQKFTQSYQTKFPLLNNELAQLDAAAAAYVQAVGSSAELQAYNDYEVAKTLFLANDQAGAKKFSLLPRFKILLDRKLFLAAKEQRLANIDAIYEEKLLDLSSSMSEGIKAVHEKITPASTFLSTNTRVYFNKENVQRFEVLRTFNDPDLVIIDMLLKLYQDLLLIKDLAPMQKRPIVEKLLEEVNTFFGAEGNIKIPDYEGKKVKQFYNFPLENPASQFEQLLSFYIKEEKKVKEGKVDPAFVAATKTFVSKVKGAEFIERLNGYYCDLMQSPLDFSVPDDLTEEQATQALTARRHYLEVIFNKWQNAFALSNDSDELGLLQDLSEKIDCLKSTQSARKLLTQASLWVKLSLAVDAEITAKKNNQMSQQILRNKSVYFEAKLQQWLYLDQLAIPFFESNSPLRKLISTYEKQLGFLKSQLELIDGQTSVEDIEKLFELADLLMYESLEIRSKVEAKCRGHLHFKIVSLEGNFRDIYSAIGLSSQLANHPLLKDIKQKAQALSIQLQEFPTKKNKTKEREDELFNDLAKLCQTADNILDDFLKQPINPPVSQQELSTLAQFHCSLKSFANNQTLYNDYKKLKEDYSSFCQSLVITEGIDFVFTDEQKGSIKQLENDLNQLCSKLSQPIGLVQVEKFSKWEVFKLWLKNQFVFSDPAAPSTDWKEEHPLLRQIHLDQRKVETLLHSNLSGIKAVHYISRLGLKWLVPLVFIVVSPFFASIWLGIGLALGVFLTMNINVFLEWVKEKKIRDRLALRMTHHLLEKPSPITGQIPGNRSDLKRLKELDKTLDLAGTAMTTAEILVKGKEGLIQEVSLPSSVTKQMSGREAELQKAITAHPFMQNWDVDYQIEYLELIEKKQRLEVRLNKRQALGKDCSIIKDDLASLNNEIQQFPQLVAAREEKLKMAQWVKKL